MSEYVEVGGVEWCITHQGILDECSDQRVIGVPIEGEDEEAVEYEEHLCCDLADLNEPPSCQIVTLYHKAVTS